MMTMIKAWSRRLGSVRLAFLASLLLSLIAIEGHLINRDGIYYIDKAGAILERGLAEGMKEGALSPQLKKVGEWVFLPVMIAAVSSVTRLGPEAAAHALNALFLAGTCALLVAWVRRRSAEAAWVACLVVLAIPAYNQYRHEILREFGFWFFSILAFWLAMRYGETRRWREAMACQFALVAAALFRLEAVVFYPVLMLWQALSAPDGQRLRFVFMISCLPLAGAAFVLILFSAGLATPPVRVGYYLDLINPAHIFRTISEAAGRLSDSVFKNKYSREEAGYILFFGLLSIIPVKFMKMCGVFVLPLAYAASKPARTWLERWQPLPWAFLAYLLVLIAFVTHQFFLVGRYVSLLNLLSAPLAAAGLAQLIQRFPRWRAPMLALALATMAANVVSFAPRKTHIIDAGHWMSATVVDPTRVGVDNARLAYYAGWRASQTVSLDRPELARALTSRSIDMAVIEVPRRDGYAEKWLAENRLTIVQRFANKSGDAVVIAVPDVLQASPATTDRSRSNTGPTE